MFLPSIMILIPLYRMDRIHLARRQPCGISLPNITNAFGKDRQFGGYGLRRGAKSTIGRNPMSGIFVKPNHS